jgi:xylulose-5-phosphate/fructose-6-phosphate phosphoketolase
MDRFQLAIDTIHRIPGLKADDAIAVFHGKLAEHKDYVASHGEDMPEVVNWRWSQG